MPSGAGGGYSPQYLTTGTQSQGTAAQGLPSYSSASYGTPMFDAASGAPPTGQNPVGPVPPGPNPYNYGPGTPAYPGFPSPSIGGGGYTPGGTSPGQTPPPAPTPAPSPSPTPAPAPAPTSPGWSGQTVGYPGQLNSLYAAGGQDNFNAGQYYIVMPDGSTYLNPFGGPQQQAYPLDPANYGGLGAGGFSTTGGG